MNYRFSKTSYDRMKGLKPEPIALLELMIKRTPVDFGVDWMGGFRTPKQQNELFLKGNSQKDGYENKSKHQSGEAFDFIPYVNGIIDRSEHNYLIIIGVAFACASELGLDIRSGLNWDRDQIFMKDQNFQDAPHIEILY